LLFHIIFVYLKQCYYCNY